VGGEGLTTAQLTRLELACVAVSDGLGHPPYLVGSATERSDFKDVDVRSIMADEEFDCLFGGECGRSRWALFCLAVSTLLTETSGLPIDYQVQRQTDANDLHKKPRNPLGLQGVQRFAGGGDATPVTKRAPEEV